MRDTRAAAKIGEIEFRVTSYDCEEDDFDPDAVLWENSFSTEAEAGASVSASRDRLAKMERLIWAEYIFTDEQYGQVRDAQPEYDSDFYHEWNADGWS